MVFHPHRPCLLLFLFIVLLVHPVQAWDGVVIRVVDGDTLLAAPKNATHPEQAALGIRLYGIDAPELNQPGGEESKAALVAKVRPGDEIEIVPVESDRYDRAVGLVLFKGEVLNLEQIRTGHAWVYDKYCRARFCGEWRKEEKKAKK